MKPLDIIYCKNCKFYKCVKVNEHSSVHSCSKSLDLQIDKPELYCNKPCYTNKNLFNKKKKN